MYQQPGVVIPMVKRRPRTVGDMMPAVVPILLAIFQLILFLAIIGLEVANVYYDAGRGTIFAGFWCAIVFLVTWIVMFAYACCKRWSACGICLILQNILCAIFATILIVFTAIFIGDPCRCYSLLCEIPNWDSFPYDGYPNLRYGCTARTREKLPVLKGLLSCAVLMLVSNLIFILAYIIGYILLLKKSARAYQPEKAYVFPYQPPPAMNSSASYELPPLTASNSATHYYESSGGIAPPMEMSNTPTGMRTVKF